MISKLSEKIIQRLLSRSIISHDEKDLYEYGLFMIISYIVFFVVSLSIGFALNVLLESVFFFVSFCMIRNYAGGFHANKETQCMFLTTLSILVGILIIRLLIDHNAVVVSCIIISLSAICFFLLKPLSSSQKQISAEEMSCYHRKVSRLTLMCVFFFLLCLILNKYSIAFSLSSGLMIANALFVIGKLQRLIQIDC